MPDAKYKSSTLNIITLFEDSIVYLRDFYNILLEEILHKGSIASSTTTKSDCNLKQLFLCLKLKLLTQNYEEFS